MSGACVGCALAIEAERAMLGLPVAWAPFWAKSEYQRTP